MQNAFEKQLNLSYFKLLMRKHSTFLADEDFYTHCYSDSVLGRAENAAVLGTPLNSSLEYCHIKPIETSVQYTIYI